ncbi:MAG: Acetyltransferase domain [Paenibacillaceae bacterium]|nr:Acetyltransferase domain [Paenibacillaceae bacterium]
MQLDHDVVVTCCANAHAEAVSQLLQMALTEALAGEAAGRIEAALSAYSKERIIRDMAGRLTYVAVYRHRVIGVILLSPTEEGGTHIEALCVAPEHHNEGIGELLIDTAERRAGELGVKRLGISALAGNAGYFRKHGYLADGEQQLSKALA